jgi:hypothetical protein
MFLFIQKIGLICRDLKSIIRFLKNFKDMNIKNMPFNSNFFQCLIFVCKLFMLKAL